jgi:hypothetical protein
MQRCIIHKQQKASSTWIKVRKPQVIRKAKHLQKPRLVLPIGRRARKHYTKDTRSSTCGSSSIPAHNMAKSKKPKGTYAPGSITRIEDGRQQIVSKRRRGTPQQRNT